jgi:predicted transcriptional regulator
MEHKILKEKTENVATSIRENFGEGSAITVINGRKFPKGVPEFVFMFQLIGKELAKKLTPSACKVLLYMVSLMEYSNHVGCNQTTLAEDLELSLRSVSRAIKELKDMAVILDYKDPQDRTRNVYMVNPHSAWKGKISKRQKFIKEQDKNQISMKFVTE